MTYKEAREYLQPVADSTPLAGYGAALSKAIEALELAESVVRCKECKHMNIVGVGYRGCKVWERIQTMGDDGYCCFGERRADNEN